MTNLVRRTVTGAFIVIFVLGGLWLHPVSFFIVGAVMIAGTQHEYYIMVQGHRCQASAGHRHHQRIHTLCHLHHDRARMAALGKGFLVLIPGDFNSDGDRAFQEGGETV
ncbi:MAG: hypothetical protein MZV63_53470 [Marinilabiliales bacterium]|nr:hypothetical protein [Marinilabiliales bacterium]